MVARPERVYVEILDEGVPVIRPTMAEPIGDGTYRLLPTAGYDPKDEHWEFPPGTVVRLKEEEWSSGRVLVARERVDGEEIV